MLARTSTRLAAALAVVILGGPVSSAVAHDDPVLRLYDTTDAAVTAAGYPARGNTQIVASRTWAITWGAADEAIGELPGKLRHDRVAHTAAVAGAVAGALDALLPDARPNTDAARDAILATLPAGSARDTGLAAGVAAAAAAVRERAGDGLDVASINAPYEPPPAALGVWRPTPPAFAPAVQAGQGRARPFVVADVATRYPPPAPAAYDSRRVSRDLEEIDRLGSVSSADRTPDQTAVALFWSQTSVGGFTRILREVLAAQHGLGDRVHLIATFHRVTTDVQITVYAAKYVFLRWRPVTALTTDDGDPRTPYDPAFVPLIATPAHPEYPSGHTSYAGAAEAVLRALAGPRPPAPIVATSPAAPGVQRVYTRWGQATQDNVDARVWEGIHLRSTDEISARFGRRLARTLLRAPKVASPPPYRSAVSAGP